MRYTGFIVFALERMATVPVTGRRGTHASCRILKERRGAPGRGEGEHPSRCPRGHPAISVSASALRMRDGQVRALRLPGDCRGRTSAAAELEGKETVGRAAR